MQIILKNLNIENDMGQKKILKQSAITKYDKLAMIEAELYVKGIVLPNRNYHIYVHLFLP